jgi:hypothetical protein
MDGDVSLAADIAYPDPKGFFDRKAVLVIRQNPDDNAKEALVARHGDGMIHLAQRPAKGARVNDLEYRIGGRGSRPGGKTPDDLVVVNAKRIGIEKHGDSIALFVSLEGEPMQQYGPPIKLAFDGTFYVGIGFCSHLPTTADTWRDFEPGAGECGGETSVQRNEEAGGRLLIHCFKPASNSRYTRFTAPRETATSAAWHSV